MKKIIRIIIVIIILALAYGAWVFLGPATAFNEKTKYFFIYSGKANKESVLRSLKENNIIKNEWAFDLLAKKLSYWNKIKPGRYEINNGENLISIIRKLRRGSQSPVKLIINKFRTKEGNRRSIGK